MCIGGFDDRNKAFREVVEQLRVSDKLAEKLNLARDILVCRRNPRSLPASIAVSLFGLFQVTVYLLRRFLSREINLEFRRSPTSTFGSSLPTGILTTTTLGNGYQ
jgi:hypothetical protein